MTKISLRMETVLGSRLLYDRNQCANGNCSWFKGAIRQKSVRMETVFCSRLLYDRKKCAHGNCSWFMAAI